MTHSAAAKMRPELNTSRGTDMHSICGGRRTVPGGRPPTSLVTSPVGVVTDQLSNQCTSASPPVASSSPNVPINACEFQDGDPLPLSTSPPVTSNQNTPLHTSPSKEKSSGSHRSKSPLPYCVLRYSHHQRPLLPKTLIPIPALLTRFLMFLM